MKNILKSLKIILAIVIFISLAGCGKNSTNSTVTTKLNGLTSIQASKLAYSGIKGGFEKTVLFRAVPVGEKNSHTLLLDEDWYENDVSGGWFFWYADAKGTDWFLVAINGNKITYKDIGTREFQPADMPGWPVESFKVSMRDAAEKANSQGADLKTLTWIEYNCDYPASDYRTKPVWALSFSENIGGSTINYTIFVDGLTGNVLGAVNDKGDRFALPIDRKALTTKHSTNHQGDVITFFDSLSKKDYDFALFQLSYKLCPNDTARAMWLENFKSIRSVKVVSIEQASLPEWTDEREIYKVTLDIKTDDSPEVYGWENGANVRWITIIPEGAGPWKVEAFNSSP